MTISIDTRGSDLLPRYGNPAFDCGGARIRAQYRHLATVVTISGAIDTLNVDRISAYSRRFILAEHPFVLDLSGVDSLAAQAISFLHRVDEDCRTAGVEWALVASQAVEPVLRNRDDETMFPTAASAHEALHYFADLIFTRRRLVLPLLSKTA